ncbi:MAG: metallophosphoesterase family protein [Actinomycetota bacterium]
MELTTVANDLVVIHDRERVRRFEGLPPATEHVFDGIEAVTLPRPPGELLCRFATVNDVHFGETECGKIDDDPQGPIQRSRPGEPPYPDMMNRAACREMAEIDPHVVLVKGDLTAYGSDEEFAAFEDCYRTAFGDKLRVVRGNHDAYLGQNVYAGDQWIDMPGICVALMDTTIPTRTTGALEPSQIDWLDAHVAATTSPVLIMGHHQQWTDGKRSDDYFGLHPDSSDALDSVVARRRNVLGYTAGHTHRHRVRPMSCGVPSVEIGCLKDFPGTWAEYRVYEGGIMQVVHRVSSPEALDWSERCRHLYSDFGIDYQSYALGRLEERCFVFPSRES